MRNCYIAVKFKTKWVLSHSLANRNYKYCTKIYLDDKLTHLEAKQRIATMNGNFEGYDSDYRSTLSKPIE